MPAFETGWRAFKIAVYVAGVLFVLLLGLGWYSRKDVPREAPRVAKKQDAPPAAKLEAPPAAKPDAPQAKSAFVLQLERAERRDLLKLLLDGLKRVDDVEARQVVAWLMPRQLRGELPYLYFVGLYDAKQADRTKKLEGAEYIYKGALIYRIDAAICGDPTANQAVPILESALGVPALRGQLKTHPMNRALLIAKALEYEIANRERPRPDWICAHGLGNFTGKSSPAPDEKAFQSHRDTVRKEFVEKY